MSGLLSRFVVCWMVRRRIGRSLVAALTVVGVAGSVGVLVPAGAVSAWPGLNRVDTGFAGDGTLDWSTAGYDLLDVGADGSVFVVEQPFVESRLQLGTDEMDGVESNAEQTEVDMSIYRYGSDGVLDNSYGPLDNGVSVLSLPDAGGAVDVVALSDGRLAIAMFVSDSPGPQLGAVYVLTADGVVDVSFGDAGRVVVPQRSQYGSGLISSLKLDGDGAIFVEVIQFEIGTFSEQVSVVRIAEGSNSIDASYGTAGFADYTTGLSDDGYPTDANFSVDGFRARTTPRRTPMY